MTQKCLVIMHSSTFGENKTVPQTCHTNYTADLALFFSSYNVIIWWMFDGETDGTGHTQDVWSGPHGTDGNCITHFLYHKKNGRWMNSTVRSFPPWSVCAPLRNCKWAKLCRNSSVGRALDWRSKGPWFNPGFRQDTKNSSRCTCSTSYDVEINHKTSEPLSLKQNFLVIMHSSTFGEN